jgi:diadenosine tetraphosphate (Ap4A) HIT family hydrolase
METTCVICLNGGPLDVIADLPTTWVTAAPSAPLPGYVCVVAKRHVAEPFELDEPEFTAVWTESMSVAAALNGLVQASKMNYEIHGNTIRHLHLHLFPRFVGDPFEGRRSTEESPPSIVPHRTLPAPHNRDILARRPVAHRPGE